ARRARELDSNSLIAFTDLSLAHYFALDFESAAECYDSALSLGPNFEMALVLGGWLGLGTNDPERALYYYKRLHEIAGPVPWSENLLSAAHALAGRHEEAEHYHRRVTERHPQDFVPPFFHAVYHRCVGDHDTAVDWLEKADHGRYGYIAFICVEPVWDPLHSHPRFQEICRRVKASKSS
ncbi:MAG: tetratricopeptide repeat protein, partial [Deltaproteobacteria bacterium]|nr:tetratricopeptide repeat protein [Deltaproteobacteria bacterium]